MKKGAAILLLILLLFNLVGYRFLFSYVQQLSDKHLETSLNNNDYNEQDLILIKAPLSLPYQTDWKDFERVDGEITIDGKIYKYVKRKVVNGEMHLLCLPDHNKMRLESARETFFQLASNLTAETSHKSSITANTHTFQTSPIVADNALLWALSGINKETVQYQFLSINLLNNLSPEPPTPPPNAILA